MVSSSHFDYVEYDPEKRKRKGHSVFDDAGSCCGFCCRMPITSLAIIAILFVFLPNLLLGGIMFDQLLGILLVAVVVGGLYYRYKKR